MFYQILDFCKLVPGSFPGVFQEGRWLYECQNFTGRLNQYTDISIVWVGNRWEVVSRGVDERHSYRHTLDAQWTSEDSVSKNTDTQKSAYPVYRYI